MIRFLYIILFAITGLAVFGQQAQLLRPGDFQNQKLNSQWIYVKYKAGATPTFYDNSSTKKISHSNLKSSLSQVLRVQVPNGTDPVSYCNLLRRTSPNLIYADPIVQYQPLSEPSDALLDNQFYLDNIRAFDAWDITKGDDDITIGIIDTGIDLDHEDIVNNLWLNTDDPVDGIDNDGNGFIDDFHGYDFADNDTDPSIQNGNHGMIVAGIAGASTNNGKGIAGVGYNTKVAALKGFRSSNGTSNGLYDAIIYAAENGFDVVNLSWGRMGNPLQSEQDIINYAVIDHDMVVVAAAGNEGGKVTEQNKWYPASYDNVLSIGATDASDNKSSGSTFNHSVDLVAPGVSMYSTVNGNGYTNGGPGTSFASPQVAATAALVKDQYPNLSAIQIMERVRVTADDIYDIGSNATYADKLGKGRLNVLRAVSESNVKSLRAENPNLTSNFGDNVFFGDTVQVSATLTSHLSAINDPLVTISSPNSDFTISNGSFEPGYMNTNSTSHISFDIILNNDIAPETDIEIRLDYAATGYTDYQFLEVTTSPDHADFGNSNIFMTISGNGDLAFSDYFPFEGSGFRFQLDTLITYAGILLGTNSSEVSDNIIANYSSNSRSSDFNVQQFYKFYHHQAADHFGYSEFVDTNRPVIIEQSNMAWENENYLIIRYRIVNNSASPISNLSFGAFSDWDLGDKTTNYAEYDLVNNFIYARNASSDLFAGVQVLGGNTFEYSSLDMASFNGNTEDIGDQFSDAQKYDYLVNQDIIIAGGSGAGNDIATINGVTINQLDPYSDTYVDVIYGVSDSQSNLQSLFSDAQSQLNSFLLKPRVLESFSACAGTSISIDPTDGDMYEFYEDPLAQDLITTATSYNPGTITKDTSFYVRNVDDNYPSDIFEVRVNLFNEIANFSTSVDTLYLDNPTTNVVQFTDESLDAISWDWNFGEGTSSNVQNPVLSFSETGTYSISLEVTNALGCVDTFNQDLVVATRPSPPTFSDVTICPGDDVVVGEPLAEKVHVYPFQTSTIPSISGNDLVLPSILEDTTVYVSGVYGSFESERVPLNIDVLEVDGQISFAPDTTSEDNRIAFVASGLKGGSTVQWTVNGSPSGSTNEISVPAIEGILDVTLEIVSEDLCSKTLNKEILISTSPFASQEDLNSCFGDEVEIRPGNGTYFGFYEDPELATLIKKGTYLQTNQYAQVYVVNLDDGLPGMPIEVNVTDQSFSLDIVHLSSKVGQKNKVELSIDSDDALVNHMWYVNGQLSETTPEPIFFFDNEIVEIVLTASGSGGCTSSDTLTLDFTLPLSLSDDQGFTVYPNPSKGKITLETQGSLDELKLFSLDGKVVLTLKTPEKEVDFTHLPGGLYILEAKSGDKIHKRQLILR